MADIALLNQDEQAFDLSDGCFVFIRLDLDRNASGEQLAEKNSCQADDCPAEKGGIGEAIGIEHKSSFLEPTISPTAPAEQGFSANIRIIDL